MTIAFLTGGTGFIGQHLIKYLLKENYEVQLLCRKGSEKKLDPYIRKKVRIFFGDITDENTYKDLLGDVDLVFHFAALFKLEASRHELHSVNVEGTRKLLESCLNKKNIKRIICCSTTGVYELSKRQITEDYPHRKFSDIHKYEWSKAEIEKVCMYYQKKHKLPIIIIRPTAVYGPGSTYLFYTGLKLVKDGKIKCFIGSGDNFLHMVHVEDVARAAIHLSKKGKVGEVYNVCDDEPIPIKEMIHIFSDAFDRKRPKIKIPVFIARRLSHLFDISPELFNYMIKHRR